MMLILIRRYYSFPTVRINPHARMCISTLRSFSSSSVDEYGDADQCLFSGDQSSQCKNRPNKLSLSPLVSLDQSPLSISEIKVVDSHTWELSSGLSRFSKSFGYASQTNSFCNEGFGDEGSGDRLGATDELDIDEIEDMRIHGTLFYKIDRGSKEFEEYKFDYHGRKPRYDKQDGNDTTEAPSNNDEPSLKGGKNLKQDDHFVDEHVSRIIKDKYIVCDSHEGSPVGKKLRKPTFNQLTGPYYEPFCLDVYISKQSVRACVVHRVTSKVVVVAHSISKDMKSDLGSTRNAAACAAVGKVLAHRALADDIHDVIFTPRKGEKLEGKLEVVLQSIRDNGVNLKLKLKQRNAKKAVVYNMP